MDSGRRRVLVVTGYATLAVLLLHDATLSGGALFRRDLSLVWYPMIEAFVRSVAAGSWPVWDPWRGFGQPLLADARAAVPVRIGSTTMTVPGASPSQCSSWWGAEADGFAPQTTMQAESRAVRGSKPSSDVP